MTMRGGGWEASATMTTSHMKMQDIIRVVEVSVSTTRISMVHTHLMTTNPGPDTQSDGLYFLDYPGPAGQPVHNARTAFARTRQDNDRAGQPPWAPFADKDEWELGRWMVETLGHQEMDELLNLSFVSTPRFLSSILHEFTGTRNDRLNNVPMYPSTTAIPS